MGRHLLFGWGFGSKRFFELLAHRFQLIAQAFDGERLFLYNLVELVNGLVLKRKPNLEVFKAFAQA